MDGLEICLNNNVCQYLDGNNESIFAKPISGTAMGPCHAPDYVDIFMGELDTKLVDNCDFLLCKEEENKYLNYSRFRDDGFTVLPNRDDLSRLEKSLDELCPGKIRWTTDEGRSIVSLDLKVTINDEGKIVTDVFSKNSHSYLPPNSCHPPSCFKGIVTGMGRRLRMICSEDTDLEKRINEYTQYLVNSGWDRKVAYKGLKKGAAVDRKKILAGKIKTKNNKLAWITKYDPRMPSKSRIIRKNLNILYSNPMNRVWFPKSKLIGADKRSKNIGEMYKPTIPKRFVQYGPKEEKGFFRCKNRCDLCRHSSNRKTFSSRFDKRKWHINHHITCRDTKCIYILECKKHRDFLYVGQSENIKKRWANHKSHANLKKSKLCTVAKHFEDFDHDGIPSDSMIITPIEIVKNEDNLLDREFFWQANLGTIFGGANQRVDLHAVKKSRLNCRD